MWVVKIIVENYPEIPSNIAGLVMTLNSPMGHIEKTFLLSHSFPIRRNSVLSRFSFSLIVDIHDWTEAKHDCKPFSAAAESPDAMEIYRWLSSA